MSRAFPPGPLRGRGLCFPSSTSASAPGGALSLIPVRAVHTKSTTTAVATPHRTPCAGWILQTCPHCNYRWIPLFCHSWRCPVCGPLKRACLTARLCHAFRSVEDGDRRLKLVTLTFRHDVDKTFLQRSMQHLVQALRRKYGLFEYARFPERTRRGRIHVHLVVMCPFIPQKTLKEAWRVASKGSYIVDIRMVRTVDRLARYVAKDLTKGLVGRVTFSRGFPNFPDLQQVKPAPEDPAKFTYRYVDIPTAQRTSAGAPQLWTGLPCYPNGHCSCFVVRDPPDSWEPVLDAYPHPFPQEHHVMS